VLKTWLSHHKDCSLSLSLNKLHSPSFLELPHLTDSIISHSARWEHTRLHIEWTVPCNTTTYLPFDELKWAEGPFSQLRHLMIGASTHGRGSGVAQRPFAGAPQLRSVVLLKHFNLSHLVLPWSQLTSINTGRITLDMVTDILREATVIRNLKCTLRSTKTALRSVPPLFHLQSLVLHDGPNPYYPQKRLLDVLTTPALGHLSVSERELGIEQITIITSLLSRLHSSLDSLCILFIGWGGPSVYFWG
jgi:hypothetical protein